MTTQASTYYRGGTGNVAVTLPRETEQRDAVTIEFVDPATIAHVLGALIFNREQRLALDQFYRTTIANLKSYYTCAHCRAKFQLWTSMGTRQCRMHTGEMRIDTWTCCQTTCNPDRGRSLKVGVQPLTPDGEPQAGFETLWRAFHGGGCTPCDHRVDGEWSAVSPLQLERVQEVLSSSRNLTADVRDHVIARLLEPPVLNYESIYEIPVLVFIRMPNWQQRPVVKIIYRPTKQVAVSDNYDFRDLFQPLNDNSAAVSQPNNEHPFPMRPEITHLQIGNTLIDFVDAYVHVTRLSHRHSDV